MTTLQTKYKPNRLETYKTTQFIHQTVKSTTHQRHAKPNFSTKTHPKSPFLRKNLANFVNFRVFLQKILEIVAKMWQIAKVIYLG
ncbi:hypothetical protein B0181_09800 [Moraxella caviae]|uniref:Uncharacterized protein n=1 Tax=Moraxella caviae TaxID=34060 RepID=A0A1S9ZWH9_9GAMM|nr:hypothetical protein B0181_09800 [Moraxella caviae]